MNPLTENGIRASFVNASRREAADATMPAGLAELTWDRLDILGWADRRHDQRSYLVVPDVDGVPVGMVLRTTGRTSRKRAMCALCEDVVAVDDVGLFVAKLAGPAGRSGNTVGTLLHADFSCSSHVRRLPTRTEAGEDPAAVTAARIAGLRQRSALFAERVLGEA